MEARGGCSSDFPTVSVFLQSSNQISTFPNGTRAAGTQIKNGVKKKKNEPITRNVLVARSRAGRKSCGAGGEANGPHLIKKHKGAKREEHDRCGRAYDFT